MENGRIYGGGNDLMALLENSNWVSSTSPSFHENMVNFDQGPHQGKRSSMKRENDEEDYGGEEFELNPYQPEKKRRLSPEIVEFLEKSFEVENKLEPERKLELAKQVGLQPRQVAIWFQNRRARYKTKQLEKEFSSLKASYDRLKLDIDSLSKERDTLQIEVKVLSKKLNQRDGPQDITPANIPSTNIVVVHPSTNKQLVEESSSAKSDVVDSGSPYYADRYHSSLVDDPTDQQSDFSQEDERLMMNGRVLLPSIPPPSLPDYTNLLKVEESECYEPIFASSCNFSLVDDQPHLWSFSL